MINRQKRIMIIICRIIAHTKWLHDLYINHSPFPTLKDIGFTLWAEFTREQSDFLTPGSDLKYKNHLQYAQIPKCQKHFSFFFFNSVQIHSVYSPSLQSLLKGCKLQTDTVRLRPHECYYEVNNPEQILAWLETTGEEQEESATS